MHIQETIRKIVCPIMPKMWLGKTHLGHEWMVIEGYALITCRKCLKTKTVGYYPRASKEGQAVLFRLLSKGIV